MNADLVPFTDGEFKLAIELHKQDGFRVQAPGLARALGFREAYDLLRNIPDEEKGSELVRTPGGDQRVGYVTEASFYRAMGQRRPARIPDQDVRAAAERFQAWGAVACSDVHATAHRAAKQREYHRAEHARRQAASCARRNGTAA